jgi:chromate reductase
MQILLISGSTRAGSSNTLALRRLGELDYPGLTTEYYGGLRELPAFVPDEQPEPPAVTDLLERIRAVDAVLFSTRSTRAVCLGR